MALDALLSALAAETAAKAEGILAAAREEADRITADTEAASARRRQDALRVALERAQAQQDAHLAGLRRAVRAEVLHARAAMLQRVFDHSGVLFHEAVTGPSLCAALGRHLQEALVFVDPRENVTVRCRPELARALRALIESRPEVTLVEDDSAGWGVSLHVHGGWLVVDNTLEARLERAWPALAIEIVRRVEGEDDDRVE